MVEWMLEDASGHTIFATVALRYFNVAGGDPERAASGQSSPKATHLIKPRRPDGAWHPSESRDIR